MINIILYPDESAFVKTDFPVTKILTTFQPISERTNCLEGGMTDADLFAKLNRILETQNLSNNDNGLDSDDFLERFSYDIGEGNNLANKS